VKKPLRAARSLLRKKQREILTWLGFPPTEWARRILRKIDPNDLTVERLLYLRDGLSEPAVVQSLSHVPSINASVLRLTTDAKLRGLVTPRLLSDVASEQERDDPPDRGWKSQTPLDLLMDTLRMRRLLGEDFGTPPFSSYAPPRGVHDALTSRIGAMDWKREWHRSRSELPACFGPPPFPGTMGIVPLTTPEALWGEGVEMRHCVASHAFDVAEGTEYIYRVDTPVRATLSLARAEGRWRLREMRGEGNIPLDPVVCALVLGLLESSATGPADEVADS
jgi:hypothetical protein